MDLHSLRILSLCTGLGGLDLGIKLTMPTSRTVAYVEIEAFACEVLARRCEEKILDDAPIWSDIKSFDGRPFRGQVDCLTGGYPCQPFSIAGKKLGDKDPRHLWPHIRRIISEVEPPICFFENVGGHLQLGFEQVHDDLQSLGYQVKAGLFTAEEVGAPHKRERLFILAYSNDKRWWRNGKVGELAKTQRENGCQRDEYAETTQDCDSRNVADNNSSRCNCGRCDLSERSVCCYRDRKCSEVPEDRSQLQSGIGSNCKNVADSNCIVSKRLLIERTPDGQSQREIERRSCVGGSENEEPRGKLENTECFGCRGRNNGDQRGNIGETEIERSLSSCRQIPLWPPRPNEFEEWLRVPESLKPAVHRMADGLADRVDEIRACGNGVIPLVAAYAFRTLFADIEVIEEENDRQT